MLLDGHELNGVVPGGNDSRQDLPGKLAPGSDFFRILGHAGVNLVYQRWAGRPLEMGIPPPVGLIRRPYLGVEDQRFRVLHHPAGIGRDAVAPASVPVDAKAKQVPMMKYVGRQAQFPLPVIGQP
jgi:hypothetical protein